jgi:hypothetical protein
MKTIQGSQALFLCLSLSLSLHSVYKELAEHKSGQKKKINKKYSLVYLMDVIIHIGLSYLSLSIILSIANKNKPNDSFIIDH